MRHFVNKSFVTITGLVGIFLYLPSSLLFADAIDCDQAITTIDINHCAELALQDADTTMQTYLNAIVLQYADNDALVAAIKQSQQVWHSYMTAHCDAIYTLWQQGSIRVVMTLSCRTSLTQQRTHQLWADFLGHDSSEKSLPEPEH